MRNGKHLVRRVRSEAKNIIDEFKRKNEPICFFCSKCIVDERELTVDHLLPISHGGRTNEDNLVICCEPCNSEKGSMNEETYRFYLNYKKEWGTRDIKEIESQIEKLVDEIRTFSIAGLRNELTYSIAIRLKCLRRILRINKI